MGAVFIAIAIAAGAALIGRLAGPADAVPVAFFGLWGALLLWVSGRLPATAEPGLSDAAVDGVADGAVTDGADESAAEPEREPDVQIAI